MGNTQTDQAACVPDVTPSTAAEPEIFRIVGHEDVAISADEIRQLIDAGDLGPNVEVLQGEDGDSHALSAIPKFRDCFRTARPDVQSQVATRLPLLSIPSGDQSAEQSATVAPDGGPKRCPHCGTANLPLALRCVCGHGFVAGFAGPPSAPTGFDTQISQAKAAGQRANRNVTSAVVWLVIAAFCLTWSYTSRDTHLIIIGTDQVVPGGISFGWAAMVFAIWKFLKALPSSRETP